MYKRIKVIIIFLDMRQKILNDIFIKWNFIFIMKICRYDITCNFKKISEECPIKMLICREAVEMKWNEASL